MTNGIPETASTIRLCRADNWRFVLDDPTPRSVRWATRLVAHDPNWSKWHFTEGNGRFTACGEVVQLFLVDGSPQEGRLAKVNCIRCKNSMRKAGVLDNS